MAKQSKTLNEPNNTNNQKSYSFAAPLLAAGYGQRWMSKAYKFVTLLILIPTIAIAAPQNAERFTHIAGINLSDLPSLKSLQKIFGPSVIIQSGDAGDYDARICYQTPDKKAVVKFFHGEVDWGFLIRKPQKKDNQCPVSEKLQMRGLSVAGISLGMDKSKYIQIVGKPTRKTHNRVENEFDYIHTLTDGELRQLLKRRRKNGYPPTNPENLRHWNLEIYTSAIFTKGLLTSFTVIRIETN